MVPTHREVLRYARNSDFDERDLSSWMAHCRKRKEIADIGFSYFLLMKIHHWQISHRK